MRNEFIGSCARVKSVDLARQSREVSAEIRMRKAELSKAVISISQNWAKLSDAERRHWFDNDSEIVEFLDRMMSPDRTFSDFHDCHKKIYEVVERHDRVMSELVRKSKMLCSVLSAEMLAEMKLADMQRSAMTRITRQLSIHGLSPSDIAEFYPTVAQQLMSRYSDMPQCSISQAVEARICLDLYDTEFDINGRIRNADTLDEIVRTLAESVLLAEMGAIADDYQTQAEEVTRPEFQPSEVLRTAIEEIEIPELFKLWALLEIFCETQATAIEASRIATVEEAIRSGISLPEALRSLVAGSDVLRSLIEEVTH